MIQTAVRPIAMPVSTRRNRGSPTLCRTGDAGCQRKTVNAQAESMKAPNSAASIRYSGQCLFSVSFMAGPSWPCRRGPLDKKPRALDARRASPFLAPPERIPLGEADQDAEVRPPHPPQVEL